MWLQDFPLHSEGSKGHSFAAETEFGKTLERVLKNLTYPESEWRSFLDATNFGDIDERCRLVLSWPDPANRSPVANGHRALAQAIRDLDLAPLPSQQLVLEYQVRCRFYRRLCRRRAQGSSLGSYKQDWLEQFYQSCVGGKPTPRQRFKRMRDVPIHPIFPSYQTVKVPSTLCSLVRRKNDRTHRIATTDHQCASPCLADAVLMIRRAAARSSVTFGRGKATRSSTSSCKRAFETD